ncbi:MAG: hypothetical protein NPIRA06_03030 [Nitrospirales bacterium]|nr:MAG: hypothetical protein NPIRA06_03030 [Nitrospirales bacterium]
MSILEKVKDMPVPKKKQISPFSLRLTPEERTQLDKDAAGMSLGAYIRSRLFESSIPKRRTRNKFPVKDHQELAKVLGELGKSRLANNMNQLAKSVNKGILEVTPETEQAIHAGCSDIRWMRHVLMAALGLIVEKDHDSERLTTWWSQATGDPSFKGGGKRAC